MTRSFKKKPIAGHGGYSEKEDKQVYNRSFRNLLKCAMRKGWFDWLPQRHATRHGGNWWWRKDGKSWVSEENRKEYPQMLRK